ncbi:MAG TPA: nucleotidyltransferase family protein [candidate division Zixibacteria bacterium]|jgi:molybdenum cofactor cytidylyltransferase
MISGLICAAGLGKRLGAPKPLLPHEHATMLQIVLDRYRPADLKEIIVVLGHDARRIVGEIRLDGLKVVINSRPSQGLSSSIQRGLAYLSPGVRGVMIGMGDMPLVATATINTLIDEFRTAQKGIVAPKYKKQRGHPVIIDLKYLDELLALRGDVGAKSILAAHDDDVHDVPIDSDEVVTDVDTSEQWEHVRIRLPLPPPVEADEISSDE